MQFSKITWTCFRNENIQKMIQFFIFIIVSKPRDAFTFRRICAVWWTISSFVPPKMWSKSINDSKTIQFFCVLWMAVTANMMRKINWNVIEKKCMFLCQNFVNMVANPVKTTPVSGRIRNTSVVFIKIKIDIRRHVIFPIVRNQVHFLNANIASMEIRGQTSQKKKQIARNWQIVQTESDERIPFISSNVTNPFDFTFFITEWATDPPTFKKTLQTLELVLKYSSFRPSSRKILNKKILFSDTTPAKFSLFKNIWLKRFQIKEKAVLMFLALALPIPSEPI